MVFARLPHQAPPQYQRGSATAPLTSAPAPDGAALRTALMDRVLKAGRFHAHDRNCDIDRLLTNTGDLTEDELYRHIAQKFDLPFISHPVRLADGLVAQDALAAGLAPILRRRGFEPDDRPAFIYAPQGDKLDWLIATPATSLQLPDARLGITTPSAFRASLRAHYGKALARQAAHRLPDHHAVATAASIPTWRWIMILFVIAAVIAAGLSIASWIWTICLVLLTCFPVMPGLLVKRLALRASSRGDLEAPMLADKDLPTYTVLVPVYREAKILPQLVTALIALVYPREKLDVKLLIESDDTETLTALKELLLPPYFDIVICPRGQPRTKPRALSIGLAYTTSDLVTVYDAEDIPEPDQLKKSASIFAQSPRTLACLQARLAIDNLDDSWLTKQFALEYAGLFDVMLKGLAALHLPVPLGGTSNHFRRSALVAVGGWDPWNVTEDADLGLRLYRQGFRIRTFNSTTYEEAPSRLRAWSHQRMRWLKGWMQTALVHLRPHGGAFDRMTFLQAGALALTTSLAPISILAHPALILLVDFMITHQAEAMSNIMTLMRDGCLFFTCFGSLLLDLAIVRQGAKARRIKAGFFTLLGIIPYSVMKTYAGWRALIELVYAPYHWRKTAHGLAKSSRLTKQFKIRKAP